MTTTSSIPKSLTCGPKARTVGRNEIAEAISPSDTFIAAEDTLSADEDSITVAQRTSSRWGAFGNIAFTIIWTASVASNVGTAMFDTASGWLITSLNANPIAVSMVQVAVSLPLFLFTLPAGALADVVDLRRLLIVVEVALLAVSRSSRLLFHWASRRRRHS